MTRICVYQSKAVIQHWCQQTCAGTQTGIDTWHCWLLSGVDCVLRVASHREKLLISITVCKCNCESLIHMNNGWKGKCCSEHKRSREVNLQSQRNLIKIHMNIKGSEGKKNSFVHTNKFPSIATSLIQKKLQEKTQQKYNKGEKKGKQIQ